MRYASNAEVTNGSRVISNATTGTLVFAQTDVLYTLAPFRAITDPTTSGGTSARILWRTHIRKKIP
ncbi:MAG TPA: hypothetical protein VGJ81_23205 [Thermoanaerobaculia bacterium]